MHPPAPVTPLDEAQRDFEIQTPPFTLIHFPKLKSSIPYDVDTSLLEGMYERKQVRLLGVEPRLSRPQREVLTTIRQPSESDGKWGRRLRVRRQESYDMIPDGASGIISGIIATRVIGYCWKSEIVSVWRHTLAT